MTHPVSRPFTVEDLEDMPDDGRRYELIDGELLVSPAPGWSHQEASRALCMTLHAACPRDLRVLAAPFAVRIDQFNELQPDVLVTRFADLTEKNLPRAPMLAVEVISPSSGLRDRSLKKAVYERMGVPSYWLVDPNRDQPALTAYDLAGGSYKEVAAVTGRQAWSASRPFPVQIVPADLVAGLRP
ncbi:MAG TPA: Uma2 family endonuclease [Streptosporangiaceae bacterium]